MRKFRTEYCDFTKNLMHQQHSRSKDCMPKAKKNQYPAGHIFKVYCRKSKIYVQTISLLNFLGFLFPFRIRIPKKY